MKYVSTFGILFAFGALAGCQNMAGSNTADGQSEAVDLVQQSREANPKAWEGRADNTPEHIRWVKHKPKSFSPATEKSLPPNTANLVFFREQDDMNPQTAVNIGINDRYQASLRGGNYTAVPNCAGGTIISTLITGKKSNDLEIEPNRYNTEVDVNYYYEVFVDELGNSQATPVAPSEALKKLQGKELQTHTISRVVQKDCAAPVEVAKKPIKLFGIYYFPFDSDRVTTQERNKANELAEKILNSAYANYEVVLAGHADPMGNIEYNQALSSRRVRNLGNALIEAGVDASRIREAAFGETKPLTLSCMDISKRSNRNNCNVKNRRVEAHVTLKP